MKKRTSKPGAKAGSKTAAKSRPATRVAARAGKRPPSPAAGKGLRARPARASAGLDAKAQGNELLGELRELRLLLAKERSVADSADAVLESGVDSLRRLLSEVMEKRNEWVLARLVGIRAMVSESPRLAHELDRLLEELGAIRFRAESMDHMDPLIHTVVEERKTPHGPEGVIVETVRPGYRTRAGAVLAKAGVAVSRRF